MDLMDKVNLFFEEMEKQGIEVQAGQTALVCKDGVVILTTNSEGSVDILVVNNRIDVDYTLGITNDEVNEFKELVEITREFNEEE